MTTKFTGGQRRRVAYGSQAGACSLKVPLLTDNPKGEWAEGLIRVPARLARAAPHTNDKHEFDRGIKEHLRLWEEWRAKRGWKMNTVPQVRGPYDPPTAGPGEDPDPRDQGMVWYMAIARFVRTEPLWQPLDNILEMRRLATQFEETIPADPLPWNDLSGSYDTGFGDPMKHAEAWRQRYGLKREDYLIGPLDRPLGA